MAEPIPGELPKRCACCGAVYRDVEQWRALPYCGVMPLGGETLELRHCSGVDCKTTLAVAMEEPS